MCYIFPISKSRCHVLSNKRSKTQTRVIYDDTKQRKAANSHT